MALNWKTEDDGEQSDLIAESSHQPLNPFRIGKACEGFDLNINDYTFIGRFKTILDAQEIAQSLDDKVWGLGKV